MTLLILKKGEQFSNAPFINKVREGIFEWRKFEYDGILVASKFLLNYRFNTEHKNDFPYY